MDIISHGLWGGAVFGRKNKKIFLIALFFGVVPDLFSFGIYFVHRILTNGFVFSHEAYHTVIPSYVYTLYNFTHSLIIFSVIFLIASYFLRRPVYEMCGWGLHIVMDIFTHSYAFFPTPFLYPFSDFMVNSIGWHNPTIFIPNVVLLLVTYAYLYYKKHIFIAKFDNKL